MASNTIVARRCFVKGGQCEKEEVLMRSNKPAELAARILQHERGIEEDYDDEDEDDYEDEDEDDED